ncbi:hypothetical protein HZA57_08540 [Candidatus Poribacteria bacterium]|nr:hypothetical protein [Candidatus Poribacteria bacterium]
MPESPPREIKPVVTKRKVQEHDQNLELMLYWLSRPEDESFEEMERLRREFHGDEYERVSQIPRSECPVTNRKRGDL